MARNRHKYRAVATWVDGIRFPSKREANRFGQLKLLLQAGDISELELQPRYPLKMRHPGTGQEILFCTYVADFRYKDRAGNVVVEDAKGVVTDVYKIKRRLMLFIYGITIREV